IVFIMFVTSFLRFFFSSRRRHTRSKRDWSSDVCSSDLQAQLLPALRAHEGVPALAHGVGVTGHSAGGGGGEVPVTALALHAAPEIGRASCRERVESAGEDEGGKKRERR